MSAHTPGPWVVDTTGSGGCVVRPVVQQHKNQRICERATFNNARLIAAAPKLAAALDAIIQRITAYGTLDTDDGERDLKAARAALAEAGVKS